MENRRLSRARTVLGARAVFNKGLSVVDGYVRDISDTGARLSFDQAIGIPDQFTLEIPKRGLAHKAHVRWREGHLLGVQFEIVAAAKPQDEPAERIKQLEQENAMLRRRVAEMAKRLDSYGDSERFAI